MEISDPDLQAPNIPASSWETQTDTDYHDCCLTCPQPTETFLTSLKLVWEPDYVTQKHLLWLFSLSYVWKAEEKNRPAALHQPHTELCSHASFLYVGQQNWK